MTDYNEYLGDAYSPESGEVNIEAVRKKAVSEKDWCNIILCGATGVGKSTLVNAIFGSKEVEAGQGKPMTQHLEKIETPAKGMCLWDTKGIESADYKNTLDQLKKELKSELDKADNEKSLPHVGWVCIKATSSRVEDRDISLIGLLKDQGIPVIVVFASVIGKQAKEFVEIAKEEIETRYSDFLGGAFVSVNSEEYEIDEDTKVKAKGLDELVEETIKKFPAGKQGARNTFLKAQNVKIKSKLAAMKSGASTIVHVASAAAGTVGASPIPGSDAPLIAAVQSTMIYKINAEFEVDPDSSKMTSVLAGIMGVTAIAQVGKAVVANALKFIPGAGTLVGGMISSATAIALTEAVGHAYISVMEKFFDMGTGKVVFPDNSEAIIDVFKSAFNYKK